MYGNYSVRGVGPASQRANWSELARSVPGLGEPSRIVLFDDFLGDQLAGPWSGASGADGSDPAIQAAQPGGIVRMATGGGSTDMSANLSALTHGLNFQADKGEMIMRARVQIDDKSNSYIFVGFTDVLATGTAELPFELDASDVLTSTATDATGFLYDTTGSDAWFVAGVAGDTDAGPTKLDVAPSDDTWVDLEVRVRESGLARFYVDGIHRADLASAVSTGTPLTPIVAASDDNTGTRNLDCDWIVAIGER